MESAHDLLSRLLTENNIVLTFNPISVTRAEDGSLIIHPQTLTANFAAKEANDSVREETPTKTNG